MKNQVYDKFDSSQGSSETTKELQFDTLGGDASLLHLIQLIDVGIRKRNRFKQGKRAIRFKLIHRMLVPVKYVAVIVYVLITQFEQPAWCLEISNKQDLGNSQLNGWSGESCNDDVRSYTNWDLPHYPPVLTRTVDCCCLLFFIVLSWLRNQYRHQDRESLIMWRLQIAIFFIVIGDNLIQLFYSARRFPQVAALMRPVMLIVMFRVLRQQIIKYLKVIRDSAPMVIFIIIYILYFSWMGNLFYKGTVQGVRYMNTFQDSAWSMLVLMTTSNYPNVMLPSYESSRLNFIFFLFYLVCGLFLIMNLLLAIIYSTFKQHYEQSLDDVEEERTEYLLRKFEDYSLGNEYLNKCQMYKYFILIHGLVNGNDEETYLDAEERQIMDDFRMTETSITSPMIGHGLDTSQYESSSRMSALHIRQSKNVSSQVRDSNKNKKGIHFIHRKPREITTKQFDYIYKNKIKQSISQRGKMYFEEVNILLNAYEFYRYEITSQQTLTKIVQVNQNEETKCKQLKRVESKGKFALIKKDNNSDIEPTKKNQKKSSKRQLIKMKVEEIAKIMNLPEYELFTNIFTVLNIASIIVRNYMTGSSDTDLITNWMIIQVFINVLFLFELIADAIVHGPYKAYSQHFRAWPETVCQVINLGLMIQYFHDWQHNTVDNFNQLAKLFELVIFIRVLKLLVFMYEINSLRIIIQTISNMIQPMFIMASVVMIIYFFFALGGMFLFGGLIRKDLPILLQNIDIPDLYHLDNFNDFFSSLVTLFTLMVVNNWYVQVQMFVLVTNPYSRYFFIAFWYFSVIIGINIFVAFALDMYASVQRLDQERVKSLKMMEMQIAFKQHNKQQDLLLQRQQLENQINMFQKFIDQKKVRTGSVFV